MKIAGYHFRSLTILCLLILLPALAGYTGAQTVTSISVEPIAPHIDVGDFIQFRAIGTWSNGSSRVLSPVPPLIAASEWSHTCAVLTNGAVKCWGYNYNGELGAGTPPLQAPWAAYSPISVNGISNATTVATGSQHSCAVLSDGTVKCWGANAYGQLGHGDTATPYYTPVSVSGVSNAIAVAGGKLHTCALLSDGTVKCWGYNYAGQLGVNRTGPETCSQSACSTMPVDVAGISNAVAIAAGDEHSCALLSDGTVKCWGWNYYGQSGNGDGIQYHISPVTVSAISTAVAIDADGHHTCALLADGVLKCWGSNFYGELGDGTRNTAYSPVTVSGINSATSIDSGRDFGCALLSDASVRCWGKGEYGSLGNGANNDSLVPVAVSGISDGISITAGALHACAVLSSGTVKCWGYNTYGALGDGTGIQSNVPVEVNGLVITGAANPVLWSSSKPPVATVNNRGVAMGIDNGVTMIAASLGGMSANTILTVGIVADIAVTKTDNPDPVAAGQNLTYTVTVTNNGPDRATGVTVTETLPANVRFISATPSKGSCFENCGVVTCNLGEMAATTPATVTIVVIPASPGVIYNTAQASANENDPNPSNNAQTIPTVVIPSPFAPDIAVSPVSHDFGSIAVGSSASKTFLISNEGTAGLTLGNLSIAGPQASQFSLGNDACSNQVIPVNNTCTVDVVFLPVSEGPKSASLSITSDDPDESPLLVGLNGGDYTVNLHSRTFVPAPGISTATRDAIINSGLARVHVLVQTKRVPTTSEVNELTTMGLRLLLFIPNLTFFASLPGNAQSVDAIAAHPVIRSFMLITPEDRIAANIKDGIDARLQYPDGTVALEVFSFFDAPMADARAAIASIVSEILAESERIRVFLVRVSPGAIGPLSQSDLVQFISEVAPPPQDDNDQVRILTNVSRVQIVEDTTDGAGNMTGTQPGAPYALDGTGVLVGQWENLHPDCSHPDFFGTLDSTGTITGTNPRVTYGDANIDCRSPSYSTAGDTTIGDHATHVAGIVLGNGSQSAGLGGGLALQWRGMAPNASIIAYQAPTLDTDNDLVADGGALGDLQVQYNQAITAGIVLSTNSWGFSHCHQVAGSCYETSSAMYDSIITDPFNPDPERDEAVSIVASAGNCGPTSGLVTRCETTPGGGVWPNWGTIRVPNAAKNTIVVGNIFSDTKALVGGSSTGPVDDGRIKPDVVAPGDQAGAGRIRSTVMTICTDDANSNPPAPGIGCLVPTSGIQGAVCTSNGIPNDNKDDCAFPYDDIGGTSMSTPATTGAAALLVQQFRTRRGTDPWPSTVKALLIHTAVDQCCGDLQGPDYGVGYGLIDVQAALDLLRDERNGHVVQSDGFAGWGTCTTQPYDPCDYDGDGVEDDDLYQITLPAGLSNYRVTLVYDDLPGAGGQLNRGIRALVNDLDLFLVGPDGSVSRPWVLDPANPANPATTGIDNRNPVEVVDVPNPAGGEWTIVVRPRRLMPLFFGPAQRYTLIYETFKPDLMIPDHEFDNGGVPSAWGGGEFVWMPARPWNSPDIILEGEDEITPGIERAVQVAVSNIGEFKVNNITVNLYWSNTGIGADYPDYLAHPMGSCVIASLDPGQRSDPGGCRILYTWNANDLPYTEGRKYVCLLATVETAGDELTYPGNDTLPEGANPRHFYVWDNNIAQKNSIKVTLEPDGGGGDIGFEIKNPELATAIIDIVQDTSKLPNGWQAIISPPPPFSLPAGGKSWAKVTLVPPSGALPGKWGEVSIYGRNQTTGEFLGGFDINAIVAPPDTIGPSLTITSHVDLQHVTTSSITLIGTASDSGKGDHGIQKVTVNGVRASNDTATGSGTANWTKGLSLNLGANTITVVAYDDSFNQNTTTQSLTIYYDLPDATPPSLVITSHNNNQHVSTSSITLSGTATDSGMGDNGIQQVTIRGNRANNDTATGGETANWSKAVNLNPGANFFTVIAYDNSANHNRNIQGITIYYDQPISTFPFLSITSHVDGQHVINSTITLSGTATDSGRGNNGIQQVTVNGSRANNDTAAGTGTAYWSKGLTLNAGLNTFTVIAYDDSPAHNSTILTITIYYYDPISNIIRVSRDGLCNGSLPCYSMIQNGIALASGPSLIEITEEAYDEDVILDSDHVLILEGGWDTNFTSCSSYTTINGSITIKHGTVIIENFIVK